MNILIKLMSIVSLVIAPHIAAPERALTHDALPRPQPKKTAATVSQIVPVWSVVAR